MEGFEAAAEKALAMLPELVCHTVKDIRDKEVGFDEIIHNNNK